MSKKEKLSAIPQKTQTHHNFLKVCERSPCPQLSEDQIDSVRLSSHEKSSPFTSTYLPEILHKSQQCISLALLHLRVISVTLISFKLLVQTSKSFIGCLRLPSYQVMESGPSLGPVSNSVSLESKHITTYSHPTEYINFCCILFIIPIWSFLIT